jgi:hypothetical protein
VVADLEELAKRAGGWVRWDDELQARTFVTMETWLRAYDRWSQAKGVRGTRS